MTPKAMMDKGRAVSLALLIWAGAAGAAVAHGLPGSVLIFSRDAGTLTLEIQLPVEELAIAAPALRPLEDIPADQRLSADQLTLLAAYFQGHLGLERGGAALPLVLSDAALIEMQDHHAGRFIMLSAGFVANLAATQDAFPLALTYDAVMHEVRSHSATVYWDEADGPVGLAEFWYRPVDGASPQIVLEWPQQQE